MGDSTKNVLHADELGNERYSEDNLVPHVKSVLIIGNGAAGSQLSTRLANLIRLTERQNIDIIVLTCLEFSEISLNMTKVLAVGPSEHSNYIYPLFREPGIRYVIGRCSELTQNEAITTTGDRIPYDVCVIATGVSIPAFIPDHDYITMKERKDIIRDIYTKIINAETVLLAGAGPIGVEMACDIKLRYRDKKYTLAFWSIFRPHFRFHI